MARATGTNKTTPSIRDKASDDVFAKDYTVFLDDSSNVPDVVHERNKVAVVAEAIQRGLRPTGEVSVASSEVKDARNVQITYTVGVVAATA